MDALDDADCVHAKMVVDQSDPLLPDVYEKTVATEEDTKFALKGLRLRDA